MSHSIYDLQTDSPNAPEDDENYPQEFYASTLVSWILFLITVPFSGYAVFVFPLMCIGIIDPPPMDPPGKEFSVLIARVLGGFLLLPLTISVAVDLWKMRKPVVHIYREGVVVRSFQKQKELSTVVVLLGGGVLLLFIAFWRLATLRAFRIKTHYLRWEEMEPVWVVLGNIEFNKKGKLSSPLLPNTYFTIDDYAIHFGEDFFTCTTQAVGNIVNIYGNELHQRAKLESWNLV